ncbi:thiol-disulfide oxidoreductase DCC family protein [Flavobacterium sp. JP2137]|uniref:thiol-disulfide oxidoreductase DCC family protein n=1 Tax=Flavobacterium sp. JP2137 TaxID=3414510 RepID=UPI003D3006BB
MLDLPKNKKIILFDGVCNLCDETVQKVIQADTHDQFRFTPLDSPTGLAILNYIGVAPGSIDSIILYEPGQAYYIKAEAALKIAGFLGGRYSLLSLLNVLPNALLNRGYDYIAKNRYRWYGKKDACMIPTPETLNKFI